MGKTFSKGVSIVFAPLLPLYIDAEAYIENHEKVFGFKIKPCFAVVCEKEYTSYFSKEEIERIQKNIKKHGLKEVDKKINLFYKNLTKINNWIRTNKNKSSRKLNNKQLMSAFNKFFTVSKPIMPYVPYMRYVEKALFRLLPERIKKKEIIEKLTVPEVESVFIQKKKHLLEIAYDILCNKAPINKKMYEHIDKFVWATIHFGMDKPLIVKDVKSSLKELLKKNPVKIKKELDSIQTNLDSIKEEKIKILKKIKLSSKEKRVIGALQSLAEMRVYIQDRQSYANYIFIPFLNEAASRLNLSRENIKWLLPEEIYRFLRENRKTTKKFLDRIKQRKQLYVLTLFDNKLTVLQGNEFKNLARDLEKENIYQNELKGQTSFKGKVKGKAIIVIKRKDFKKVKKGNILITTTTTPNFMPILELVKAIVTDYGGLTSHAAIVSRELKIPCIIGTKIATKVLKDGDLVEVDANKGIVKIIKKAK